MINFKMFLEITDVIDSDVSDIEFIQKDDSFIYNFKIEDFDYKIYFIKQPCFLKNIFITEKNYNISFYGPKGVNLTNLGKGASVYKYLIKTIKAFVNKFDYECLEYSGANSEQEIMYNAFYHTYFKKYYTRIKIGLYIKNEFLEYLKNTHDPRWKIIQEELENSNVDKKIEELKQTKNKSRYIKLIVKNKINSIVLFNKFKTPVFITKLRENKVSILFFGNINNVFNNSLNEITVDYHYIEPIDVNIYKEKIDELIEKLKEENIFPKSIWTTTGSIDLSTTNDQI